MKHESDEVRRAQEANAAGDRSHNRIGLDATLTAASQLAPTDVFLSFRLGAAGWKSRRSLLPDQPEDGFTVRASLEPEEIELLCRTYETGDDESRKLTRLLAQLSVTR